MNTTNDLWGGLDIEVIGATGEFESGKTMFGLLISPGPRTRWYDQEGSATIYRQQLGFQHVDVAKEMLARFPVQPGQMKARYKAIDLFKWWWADAMAIPAGSLDVLGIDPVSELEDGLVDYVKQNCGEFGLSSEQMKKSSGLMWGAVKSFWKSILNDLRVRCKTLYFTSHMRYKYVGNTPTNQREAKGKETLFELASLYLQFNRDANAQGIKPEAPSATVLKSRVSVFVNGVPHPMLPPRLPIATPDAIRWYIANPPDYQHLKVEERVQVKVLSDDEKLAMQANIAEAQRETAQAELSKIQMLQQAAMNPMPAPAPVQAPIFAAPAVVNNANGNAHTPGPSTAGTMDDATKLGIRMLLEELDPPQEAIAGLLASYGVQGFGQLTQGQAVEVLNGLRAAADRKRLAGPKPTAPIIVAQQTLAETDNFFRRNLEEKASGTH